ncbi:DUF4179 domain-containing protein [Clostridium sp. YIM B02555]|uniref:DUF4179 domain-containing protein n=1 Tax=Clostridium sp. YIM B02555 TaxID=2911968 RepID=UPI001EEE0A45|nr:DUF4179 domain-containing protein [Clostridium sp. YIM B02555]
MRINDELFDEKVRGKIKNEINYVPEDINSKLNDAINKLGKRRSNAKKIASICSIFIIGMLLLGITMPAYASNIPIIGGIFKIFNDKRYEKYDEYSSDLNITKESNGVKITINKVVYDGLELNLFYTIESEEEMKHIPNFDNAELKINGSKVSFSSGGKGKFIDDKKTFVGITQYSIGENNIRLKELKGKVGEGEYIEIPDKFMLNININKIEYTKDDWVNGNWEFNIPVSNEKINGKVNEKDCNIDLSDIVNGYQINKIIATPINTAIQGVSKDDNGDGLSFSVFDNKGRFFRENGSSASSDIDKDGNNTIYFNNEFKEVYEDTEALTFIPYRYTRSGDTAPKIITKLNLKGETKIYTNDGKEYAAITKVESEGGKTKIQYKSKYGIKFEPIEITNNKNGEKVLSFDDDYNEIEQNEATTYLIDSDEYVFSFDRAIKDGDYSVSVIDNSKLLEIYNDKKFTIKIK